ncbi:MAG: FemAB family PEP-CTERM system-associated protein [Acidobacteriota bacterium]|nr:FemAB family PEP-CTERM system-associated protein [Acidobacteriota bacterium]
MKERPEAGTLASETDYPQLRPQTCDQQLQVRFLLETEWPIWDGFVHQHPHGSPFHLTAWKQTIEECFSYKAHYLVAWDNNRIRAVLPLFLIDNPILGRVLVSSPFAVYGGILADTKMARDVMYEKARALGESLGVDYIELRNRYPEQCVAGSNLTRYVTFTREVYPQAENILLSLPKKTRNVVRKSFQHQFATRYALTDLSVFTRVYSSNMHRIGAPSFSLKYFQSLVRNFGPLVDVREVWLGQDAVAVSLNFLYRGEMHTYYAAAESTFNQFAPNTFMYFDHLRWAGENGYKTFDFGRSKRDGGVYDFKKHWGTNIRELPYEICSVKKANLSDLTAARSRFNFMTRVWQKLPLPIARVLSRAILPLFP